jgi:hypothetical protein
VLTSNKHIKQTTVKTFLPFLFLIATAYIKIYGQKNLNVPLTTISSDSACELISIFYHDSTLYCIYDTIAIVNTAAKDTSVIFAIRYPELKDTPCVEIFLVNNERITFIRKDTLITDDCVPCDSPRDFNGITQRRKKGYRQVLISCSYFYSRHGLVGTVYRTFVYKINSKPVRITRDLVTENKLKRTNIGKMDGE